MLQYKTKQTPLIAPPTSATEPTSEPTSEPTPESIDSYATALQSMSLEEMRAQLLAQHEAAIAARAPKGYQSTNPTAKDELNVLFTDHTYKAVAHAIARNVTPIVVVLDHTEFKSTRALIAAGIPLTSIRVPQYDPKVYRDMAADPILGACVTLQSLDDALDILAKERTPIAGVYADLMCTYTGGGIACLQRIQALSLVSGAVVGITICLRTPNGVEFTYADATNMIDAIHCAIPVATNLVRTHLCANSVYVYGAGAPMATAMVCVRASSS